MYPGQLTLSVHGNSGNIYIVTILGVRGFLCMLGSLMVFCLPGFFFYSNCTYECNFKKFLSWALIYVSKYVVLNQASLIPGPCCWSWMLVKYSYTLRLLRPKSFSVYWVDIVWERSVCVSEFWFNTALNSISHLSYDISHCVTLNIWAHLLMHVELWCKANSGWSTDIKGHNRGVALTSSIIMIIISVWNIFKTEKDSRPGDP